MVKFPSEEWLDGFARNFNETTDDSDADKAWKGSVGVGVLPDKPGVQPVYMYMYLAGGQCTETCMLNDPKAKPIDIIMSAPVGIWQAVFDQKLSFITALARRKIKIEGNSVVLMRYILKSSPKKWRKALLGTPVEFSSVY